MPKKITRGLGRLHAPDARDREFPLRAALPSKRALTPDQQRAIARGWRNWYAREPHLNQGPFPHCVGYSWVHWLTAGPRCNKGGAAEAKDIYHAAQLIDEWPGEGYEGTSVRAGAKVLQDRGYISEYRWGFTVKDITDCLLTTGPIVVGLNWYEGMDSPVQKANTFVMHATGQVLGGHAFTLVGVNMKREMVRIKNSWGRGWADNGLAWLPFKDLAQLLNENGEACLAVEICKP